MLSVNYISNFLSEKQTAIDCNFYNKIKDFEINKEFKKINFENKYECNLPVSFDILFNKSVKNFYYDNKIYKNKSPIFSFLNSIFLIGDKKFHLNDMNEKEKIIKEFLKNMDNDLFQKDLYAKFNYTKNRKFNKGDIQMVLKNGYLFKHCDKFHLLKEYIADYLGINIYILKVFNGIIDFNHNESYLTQYYGKKNNKYVPHFILLFENEIYKPIIQHDNHISILTYEKYDDIIDNIWNYFKIPDVNISDDQNRKYTNEYLNLLKVDDIKKLCEQEGIELKKISDKTNKMINKVKLDLINDLLKISI